MAYPLTPDASAIAEHFSAALRRARRDEQPYRHWKLAEVLPESLCTGILTLPIAPPQLGKTDGTRDTYNEQRCFFTPLLRSKFPSCAALCDALQRPDVARLLAETCDIEVEGSFLRMEYIQDTDGAWLEPHRDIPRKAVLDGDLFLHRAGRRRIGAPTSTTPSGAGSADRRENSIRR